MENRTSMRALRAFVRLFDRRFLSRLYHVQVFSNNPEVIVRIQVVRLSNPIVLPDGVIPAGSKAITLHLWNERLPAIPSEGADLAYARTFYRLMRSSLEALGRYMQEDRSIQDVCVVGGVTSHVWLNSGSQGGSSMLRRLGFTLFPASHPLKKFGIFLDNFYTWILMWTFNPISLRRHKLFKLQRVEGWMTAMNFLERYGDENPHG